MAILQCLCGSFLYELMKGIHVLDTDTLKMALYDSSASLTADTTAYTATNEITGTGYSAGGKAITNPTVLLLSGVAALDFDDVEWAGATFIARGAMIYNSSKANRAIGLLDFGGEKVAAGGTFRVKLPPALSEKAFLRLTSYRG